MIRIAFSGKMTAGKTTISDMICENFENVERRSIGDGIKDVSKLIIGDFEALEEKMKHFKGFDTYIIEAKKLREQYKDKEFEFDESGNFIKNKLYRPYVQSVGKIARDHFGEGIWIKDMENIGEKMIICDDVRTEYEFNKMREKGVVIIRLEVDEEKQRERIVNLYGSIDENSLNDITETVLDDKVFDFVLDTTKDKKEDTYNKVVSYLKMLKLLPNR